MRCGSVCHVPLLKGKIPYAKCRVVDFFIMQIIFFFWGVLGLYIASELDFIGAVVHIPWSQSVCWNILYRCNVRSHVALFLAFLSACSLGFHQALMSVSLKFVNSSSVLRLQQRGYCC